MFDHRLVRKINLGHCFVLVGSGASAELGYPSWRRLAECVIGDLGKRGKLSDEESYSKYLRDNQLPELFSQAERDLGSRETLIDVIKGLVQPVNGRSHHVYDLLTNWPFGCYLTTNWDDEIDHFLRLNRLYYKALQNTREDFAAIRHDASNFIIKLHSDLNHPHLAVITSADYQRLISQEWTYFRDRLKAIFEMFDVFVVGHSLSDPDLRLILQFAKEMASPEHPIFMITANLTKADEHELLDRFNIVALPYQDTDGTHAQLRRILSLLDKFIIPRRKRLDLRNVDYSPHELEAAQAVAIYRRFANANETEIKASSYLGPLVLQTLNSIGNEGATEQQLLGLDPLATALNSAGMKEAVPEVFETLRVSGLLRADADQFQLTELGRIQAQESAQQRTIEEEQAYGQFFTELSGRFGLLGSEQQHELVELLRGTLVRVFKQRGLSIANAIFMGRSLEHDALSDVFNAISSEAAGISNRELALAFMEAAQVFILEPSDYQKRYLASLSQGFFLYHLFGLDPTCAKIRREIFQQTIWWCDSSILIPLVALGCANHEYAQDLFTRLQALEAFTLTTSRLLTEIVEHLEWFSRLLERERSGSAAVLAAATQTGSYKQNLFLDGFVRSSAEGKVASVGDYIQKVCPFGATELGVRKLLEAHGVHVLNIDELEGFTNADTREMFELSYEISEARSRSATLRSPQQVEAEAEILLIIRKLHEGNYVPPIKDAAFERSYFLSQSRVLDRIPPANPVSWTPEALYRYIGALPGERLDPDLLQRCMLHEYFASGVVVVDVPRYEKYFGPAINVAHSTYQAERDQYLREFPDKYENDLDSTFSRIPDLQKPLFVEQMGWKLARQEQRKTEAAERQAEFARKQAADAISESQQLRQEMDVGWKRRKAAREKQLAAEERNASDPKHLRKRLRQAKRRKKRH